MIRMELNNALYHQFGLFSDNKMMCSINYIRGYQTYVIGPIIQSHLKVTKLKMDGI